MGIYNAKLETSGGSGNLPDTVKSSLTSPMEIDCREFTVYLFCRVLIGYYITMCSKTKQRAGFG